MKVAFALVGLCLASCAEPSVIETINIQVNHDHPYSHYTRPVREARLLKPGGPGNCTDIARTKQAALEQAGVKSTLIACRLKTGEGHAFLVPGGQVLDNRFDNAVTLGEVGCK
jgi:predicted transglutaminase-like cysteine proteinase